MPIPNARYRVKTFPSGKKVRLAFQGGRVVETKSLTTGEKHTPAEFAADRAKRRGRLARHVQALRGAGKFRSA
jgi:hypothetical protein